VTQIPAIYYFRVGVDSDTTHDLDADAGVCTYAIDIQIVPVTVDIFGTQGTFSMIDPNMVNIKQEDSHATFTINQGIAIGYYDLTITFTDSADPPV